MDFFAKQERARRNTAWLVFYFGLAVVLIIAALHVAFSFVVGYPLTDWESLGWVAGGVVACVLAGSLVKMAELSQGGRVVASMLGGRPVDLNSAEPGERRLINVVEEMSLASGVPVPELYILDEKGINAFAAGHGAGDAVIGVTRGCLERLTRDELQGVIAHEFSHILHGDMRMNIRLIGVLNGILFLALIGGVLIRMAAFSRSSSSDNRSGVSVGFVFMLAGLALYLVGWIGVFFGKLIKAAVSRQREFLADASAVQFTRHPDGLAGALAKIQRTTSRIESTHAEEASHMYFGNGLADPFFAWLATHPPIEKRVAEIAPDFDWESARRAPLAAGADSESRPSREASAQRLPIPGVPQLAVAAALLESLPGAVREAVHELHAARGVVFALLLSEDEGVRGRQLALLDPDALMETKGWTQKLPGLSSAQKLALVDLAIPVLRHLSPEQYNAFRASVVALVEADGQIHLFEYTLQKILVRHLDLFFTRSTGAAVRFRSVVPLLPEAGVVLSALASSSTGTPASRDEAFEAGVRELLVKPSAFPLRREEVVDLSAFDAALDKLALAAPDVKRALLTACGAAVMQDGIANDPQVELLRAVADVLDCPLPPFVRVV